MYPKSELTLSEAPAVLPDEGGLLAEDREAARVIAALIAEGRWDDIIDYVWPDVEESVA